MTARKAKAKAKYRGLSTALRSGRDDAVWENGEADSQRE
jgi:hypothetical protein